MKEKIKTIYCPRNTDFIIIEFDNGKQIAFVNIRRTHFQNQYCDKLKDLKRAPILVKNIEMKGFDYDEVDDITEKNGEYILFVFGPKKNYETTISPNELKVVLNCDKKEF